MSFSEAHTCGNISELFKSLPSNIFWFKCPCRGQEKIQVQMGPRTARAAMLGFLR